MRLPWIRTRKPGEISESKLGYALSLPSMLLIFALGIYPVSYTIILSFNKLDLGQNLLTFIGLSNYSALLKDEMFWKSLCATLYFTIVSLGVQIVFGTAIAMLLNQKFKGRGFVRACVLIPWSVPTIVNAALWGWIYEPNYGALNRLLLQWNIIEDGMVWLGKAGRAMNLIILADTWRMLPLTVIMVLASLQTVSHNHIEAAMIDGATPLARFRYIYLPALKPILLVVLVLRTMQSLRVFDIVYQLTQGGPAGGTMTISFFSHYQTFKYLNFGYGSAIAVFVSLLTVLFSIVYMAVLRSDKQ